MLDSVLLSLLDICAEVLADPGVSGDLRAKLALRHQAATAALAAHPCGHTIAFLRVDGVWAGFEDIPPVASVTCVAPDCGRSFAAPLRAELESLIRTHDERAALLLLHGGERADIGVPFEVRGS